MTNLYKLKYVFGALLFFMSFVACKKDQMTQKELYTFISPEFNANPVFELSVIQNYSPFGLVSNDIDTSKMISGPFKITRAYSVDVNVTIQPVLDSTLIVQYNQKNGTHYQALKDPSMIKFSSMSDVVKAGNTSSSGQFYITINPPKNTQSITSSESKTYIQAFEIKPDAATVQVSPNRSVFYVIVNLNKKLNNIKPNGSIDGLTAINRTNWSATSYDSDDFEDVSHAIDGDYGTSWFTPFDYNKNEVSAVFDMKSAFDVKGIQFSPAYFGGYITTYNFNHFVIETSSDGVNFSYQGEYTRTTAWTGNSLQPLRINLAFYAPVKAQFIKVRASSGSFGGLSEIVVFN